MTIVVDTGPLVAYADATDRDHGPVAELLDRNTEVLIVPFTVIQETAYLLGRFLGATEEAAFLRSLGTAGMLVEQIGMPDLQRCAELVERYADSRIGIVDASIVAVAERLNITRILTLDRRHFSYIRPRHTPAFELLPRA